MPMACEHHKPPLFAQRLDGSAGLPCPASKGKEGEGVTHTAPACLTQRASDESLSGP